MVQSRWLSVGVVWKTALLADDVNLELGPRLGRILATVHSETWEDPAIRNDLSDLQVLKTRWKPIFQ